MKKLLMTLCFGGIGIFLIFSLTKFEVTPIQEKDTSYFVSGNDNNVYNEALYQWDYAFSNPALPYDGDVVGLLEEVDIIKSIVPFYPLTIDENKGKPSEVTITSGTQIKTIYVPFSESEKGDGSKINPINHINLKTYVDEQSFLRHNSVVKKFDCDSGIYISERLYSSLKLDNSADTLNINANVLIPFGYKIEDSHVSYDVIFEENDDYHNKVDVDLEVLSISEYEEVNYTFEIEGVISSNGDTTLLEGIGIPYEIAKTLFQTVDRTQIELSKDEFAWQPNTWLIECNGNVSREQLGSLLQEKLSNFSLGNSNMHMDRETYP